MLRPGSRRVLLIDPNVQDARTSVDVPKAAGIEATAVADAETGLRTIAQSEPDVLIMELELHGKDGRWLLRRLRDDFMGVMPRVVLYTKREALAGAGVIDLGADVVVLKPASPAALVAAAAPIADDLARVGEADRIRELIRLTVMQGDVEWALNQLSKRLALTFRCGECIAVAQVGERQYCGVARGPEEGAEWDEGVWERCQVALDASVPLFMSGPNGSVTTYLGTPIAMPGGVQLGFCVLIDEVPRIFAQGHVHHLRALAQRVHAELAWRSVHERIASDRDRLRESSMLDPLLAGVWTRAALDQALPTEVAACIRRGEQMSLVVLDLRGLRHLNERYGHVVGDDALRHIASLVRGMLRTQDLVARFGGDTLAVVLGGTPVVDAKRVIERVQEAISTTPLIHADQVISLQVTAGVAALHGGDDSGDAAFSRAHAALKAAKRRREPILVADHIDEAELGALSASAGLEPGTTLGGMYQILHEISRGAMGVVYRAEDLGLGRPIALKTLRPDLARDRNFVERFRTEAATLAAIRHENLVQVYAFGMDGDDVYFVMELVEGEPLEDRVELARHEGKMMSFVEIASVVTQTAGALDAMHKAGVLHRDVKPANILLDRGRSRAVLVDVGIAKKRGTPTDPAGTPGFTAPESFTGATEGVQADVYGLAATAYTLLTAEMPFPGTNMEEILRNQMRAGPIPASAVRPGIPPAVDAILQRAMDPDAVRRHASAGDFARALHPALHDETSSPGVRLGTERPKRKQPHEQTIPRAVRVPDANADGSTAVRAEPLEPTTAVRDKPVVITPHPDQVAVVPVGPTAPSPPPAPPAPPPGPVRMPGRVSGAVPVITADMVADGAPALIPSLREPELPQSTLPHTRGVLFRSSYRVLGARHGAAWVASVSRRNQALAQALQPQSTLLSWHPTDLFVFMLEAIGQSGRDARAFARELGKVATAATFGRFFGADPTALSPWHVLSAAEHFWRRYHTWGSVGVARDGEHGARVTIEKGPKAALVCASTAGILEQVVVLSGAAAGEVTHPTCEAQGAVACEFRVKWQSKHA